MLYVQNQRADVSRGQMKTLPAAAKHVREGLAALVRGWVSNRSKETCSILSQHSVHVQASALIRGRVVAATSHAARFLVSSTDQTGRGPASGRTAVAWSPALSCVKGGAAVALEPVPTWGRLVEVVLGTPFELWTGAAGESPSDRAARMDVATEVLAELEDPDGPVAEFLAGLLVDSAVDGVEFSSSGDPDEVPDEEPLEWLEAA